MAEIKKKQLFGTNGVRAVVGEAMNPQLAMNIGLSLSKMRPGTLAVGMDTRTSGPALINALKAGILSGGCDVVDLGVLPTPALQYLVRKYFDGGAVVTASHNPPEYNGVKLIDTDGTEMGDDNTIALEEILFSEDFDIKDWRETGEERHSEEMLAEYIDAVAGYFPKTDTELIVAVDPGSGPACKTTPQILSKMGCRVHTINGKTDGTFPGRLPEPSPEGLMGLSELTVATGASFGVAHDGDADRAVFVDDRGEYVEENEEFALMQMLICKDKGPGVVVTPVSTSKIVEKIASEENCTVIYTKVGSIYVARKMLELSQSGENVLFGGEGNGGLIFPGHQHCRDGGMTAASMAYLISTSGKKLSELRSELPPKYMKRGKVYTEEPDVITEKIQQAFKDDSLDLTDGVRVNRDNSWALLRPSGTEPFMRLFVEGRTKEESEKFYDEIIKATEN
ncbi:phosphoglucosamine mutase [Methanoplanus endosymbiosus]|uniref:Phosphoglucosamine mutase n=1 Tax=Methanoplanus endosymbiosus TaxID=33865 RepID=A0A9E7PM80_9EURY|nr:phosphoglucosamine mutase [Methanoplanus endosymbiosus]UUX92748.1 phosphoglucosamine mutase [Methanoplanus endosymbiosus]